jgi:hypothetical protein
MAVAPLFLSSMDELQERLRLSGISAETDAEAILEQAVRAARWKIYAALDTSRIAAILSYTATDTPSTDNEYLRQIADDLEVKLVKLELTWSLPMLFQDTSGEAIQAWNDEGTFRSSETSLDKLRKFLNSEIERAFEILRGEDPQDTGYSRAILLGPKTPPPPSGGSI